MGAVACGGAGLANHVMTTIMFRGIMLISTRTEQGVHLLAPRRSVLAVCRRVFPWSHGIGLLITPHKSLKSYRLFEMIHHRYHHNPSYTRQTGIGVVSHTNMWHE